MKVMAPLPARQAFAGERSLVPRPSRFRVLIETRALSKARLGDYFNRCRFD
jgi:hypothetical protein